MALIVSATVREEYGGLPKDASRFYISIPSKYLSEAYELIQGDKVHGEILKVKLDEKDLPEFEGKKIELIVGKGVIYDYLYISKKNWEDDFREYGLVNPGYRLELRLDEVIIHTGEKVKLYSKRDVMLRDVMLS